VLLDDLLAGVLLVCGVIIALATVLGLVGKGLAMLWQWRFGNEIKLSLARLEEKLDQHLEWHGEPGSQPARPLPSRTNGGQARQVPRKR